MVLSAVFGVGLAVCVGTASGHAGARDRARRHRRDVHHREGAAAGRAVGHGLPCRARGRYPADHGAAVRARWSAWWNAAANARRRNATDHGLEPAQYLQFAGERLRPALDLLARVPLEHPRTIVDLGCGAGNVTRMLGERWPEARIVGVDNSPEMLDAGARRDRRRSALHVRRGRPRALAARCAGRPGLQQRGAALAAGSRGAVCARGGDGGARRRAGRADARQFPCAVAHVDRRTGAYDALAREARADRARAAGGRGRRLFRRGSSPDDVALDIWQDRIPAGAGGARRRRASGRGVDEGHVARADPRGARWTRERAEFLRDYMQRLARRLSRTRAMAARSFRSGASSSSPTGKAA